MDIARELERIIAVYFSGQNYYVGEIELSKEDSKIIAYQLIHTLQLMEMIMAKDRKRMEMSK